MTAALLRAAEAEIAEGIDRVPPHLREGLIAHILHGRPVGRFLTSLLSNDLREAVGRADDVSLGSLRDLVIFLHNNAPGPCWGSPAAVEAWRARGGASGGAA